MPKTAGDLLIDILRLMSQQNASDVYLKADRPPILRIEGELVLVKTDNLTAEQTQEMSDILMNIGQKERFAEAMEINLIHHLSGIGRFRVNIYRQKGTIAMVIRRVLDQIRSIDDLQLPPVLKDIALYPRGLVLVTGPVGSGKSTTLAAMIDWVNRNRTGHILTIEDPVEFLFEDKNCLISQREVASDTNSFSEALRNAVRQTPDVIMIGEMRDKESVSSSVFFAETGHLVLSSLHSTNANQALERVVNFFPSEMHPELYILLSLNMRAIISQRLVPRLDGKGRVAAVEVLINNARFSELLRKGEFSVIKREMDLFNAEGVQSMDSSLLQLYQQNIISKETALAHAESSHDLRLKMKTTAPRAPIAPAAPPPEQSPAH